MANEYDNPLEAQNVDDGAFNAGDVGQAHADALLGGDILSGGEKQASKKPGLGADSKDTQGAQGAREREMVDGVTNMKNVGKEVAANAIMDAQNFVSRVTGHSQKNKQKATGLRGFLQRVAPVVMILAGVAGFAGVTVSGQMSLPIALAEQVIRRYDNMSVENQLIGKNYMKRQLNPRTRTIASNGEAKNYLKKHGRVYALFTGNDENYFKMSDYQKKKLAQKNIELVDFPDGSGRQYMQYTEYNQDGTVKKVTNVVADADQIGDIPGAVDFESAMATDADTAFATAYYEGAKTFRSAVGDWFKTKTTALLEKLGVSRNRFNSFDSTQDAETRKQQMLDTMVEAQNDQGIDGKIDLENIEQEEYEEDGETRTRPSEATDGDHGYNTDQGSAGFNTGGSAEGGDAGQKSQQAVEASVKSKMDSIADSAGKVTDVACTVSEITGNINTIVTAYETLMVIRLAATILEGIQKTQVTDSNESPIAELINAFTDKSHTTSITVADLDATKQGSISTLENEPEDSSIATKEYKSKKSAMESASIVALFGGTVAGIAADSSFASFSFSSFFRAIIKRLGSSMTSVKGCAYAEMAQAAIQLVNDIKAIVQCFIPPLVGCVKSLADKAVQIVGKIAWNVVKAVIKSVIISALVPFVANILMKTVANVFFGEELGTQAVNGFKAYTSKIHHSQGGAYQTPESYMAYLNMKDDYEEGERLYAQRTKSPFDASSPYTFAGSLFSKAVVMQGALANTNGFMGVMTTVFSTTSSSAKALIPGANAASHGIDVQLAKEFTDQNCPNQAAAGFIVDPTSTMCSTIVATTPYTVESDPGENLYLAAIADNDNFEDDNDNAEDDLPPVGKGGAYAKYLEACTMSDVKPGEADYNLKNKYESATTGSVALDAGLGIIPLVGSGMSLFNSQKVIRNAAYIDKRACKYDYNPSFEETLEIPSKDELKVYGAIYPQSRVAVGQGLTDKDIVGDYIKEYYKENPIDTSFEGILAHFSGLTKETVIATIDQMNTLNFLAHYEPDGYGPLFYEEEEREYNIEEDNTIEQNYVIASNLYFEEHRMRNYAC